MNIVSVSSFRLLLLGVEGRSSLLMEDEEEGDRLTPGRDGEH